MDTQQNPSPAPSMKMIERKSGLPILAFGAVWLIYALCLPLYKPSQFIVAGVLSVAALIILSKIIPTRVEYVAVPDAPVATGQPEADALIATGRGHLAAIEAARETIEKAAVKEQIAGLVALSQRILAFAEKNPESADDLRRFGSYYLPTLQKLVEGYSALERQGAAGENITGAMAGIEKALTTMTTAFKRQLDALFAGTALDISTDIAALDSILAGEGLADGPNTLGGTQNS
jgi:hypothetical protein